MFATLTTIILVYIIVGRIDIAAMVGGLEIITQLILYYFHKRFWNKMHLGKHQLTPFVLWFTGLSGSGKSTIADKIYEFLKRRGLKVERLDGDTVRSIFPQTGFTKEERNTHIKRIGYLASILEKNGIIVIASFVSPYNESRDFVRNLCNNFVEVFVDASLERCEERDVKGLYAKARRGEIKNFTGISDPFEVPENPEIVLNNDNESIDESFKKVNNYIEKNFNDYIPLKDDSYQDHTFLETVKSD